MRQNGTTSALRLLRTTRPDPIHVGVDIVSISEVAESLEPFGERYIRRVFTAREASYCRAATGSAVASRFAARFAAKEAVLKALRPNGSAIDWRSIEVCRHPSGWCDVVLHGRAASLATRRGINRIALSMSHDDSSATAVVVMQSAACVHHREQ